jgi:hypothetical protein
LEINPLWLLYLNEGVQITGGVSLFNISRKAEIAFPIVYRDASNANLTSFYLGTHYRHFLGNTQNGFYLAGVGEFNISEFDEYFYSSNFSDPPRSRAISRLGLGCGISFCSHQ